MRKISRALSPNGSRVSNPADAIGIILFNRPGRRPLTGLEELNSLRNFARSAGRSGGCRTDVEVGAAPVGCGDLGTGLAVDLGTAFDVTPST